ncbi:MAG: hypothetical protein ACLPYW_10125 [Acidimicrobiales bacterium]
MTEASELAKRSAWIGLLTAIVLALIGVFTPAASAAQFLHQETGVAAISGPNSQLVGPHEIVLPGGSRPGAPNYDQDATGSSVAAEGDVGATEPGWGPGTPAAGQPPDEPTIAEILKGKLGSIQRAPLPSGSPAWSDITNMTLSEIRAGAQENLPGYRTILKLLTDSRFNK